MKWRVGLAGIAAKTIEAHKFIKEPDGSITFVTGTGEIIAQVASGWKYVELVKDGE